MITFLLVLLKPKLSSCRDTAVITNYYIEIHLPAQSIQVGNYSTVINTC